MAPKMFHLQVSKGGSEVVPENLVKPLNLGFTPDELAISLWSVVVGHRSLTNYPLYMDNANVHLPDFTNETVREILVLTILIMRLLFLKRLPEKLIVLVFPALLMITTPLLDQLT